MAGGQGVAGSNPAVPTGNRLFSNVFIPQESPQESQSRCKRPLTGMQPIMVYDVLPGHLPIRHSQRRRLVKGSKIAKPEGTPGTPHRV
jgi:hypothetical protein